MNILSEYSYAYDKSKMISIKIIIPDTAVINIVLHHALRHSIFSRRKDSSSFELCNELSHDRSRKYSSHRLFNAKFNARIVKVNLRNVTDRIVIEIL